MRYLNHCRLLPGLIIAALAAPVMALPDDSQQPITIQSDTAEQTSNKKGEVTVYKGSVVIIQGSMRLEGSKVIIFSKNRSVNRVIATGKPARFQQQSGINDSPVKAYGNRIEYHVTSDNIVLLYNAGIYQDQSTVSGQRIDYNIVTERIKAKGKDDKSTRVHMVLEPDKQKQLKNKEDDVDADSK